MISTKKVDRAAPAAQGKVPRSPKALLYCSSRLTYILHRSQQRKETPLVCLYPNCVAGLFGTHVKLVQHYRRVHLGLPDRRDGTFLCDYERCKRSSVPFRRLDALREHLRKTHKEAIQKNHRAHSGSSIAVQVEHMDWWRCTKCLQKIERNQEKGYCPNHKSLVGIGMAMTPMEADWMSRNKASANAVLWHQLQQRQLILRRAKH